MTVDPIQLMLAQLDRIERQQERIMAKIDDKVDYRLFNDFKRRMEETTAQLEETVEQISRAAVSPDQVTTLIGTKLQESQARGITARDRWIRWSVAAVSIATFILLTTDRFLP